MSCLANQMGKAKTHSYQTKEEACPKWKGHVKLKRGLGTGYPKPRAAQLTGLKLQQRGFTSTHGWEFMEKEDNLCKAGKNDSGVSKE